MTTRAESLRRCRCACDGTAGWCGQPADQEDGLCGGCRGGCRPNDGVVLTVEQVLIRDGVVKVRE